MEFKEGDLVMYRGKHRDGEFLLLRRIEAVLLCGYKVKNGLPNGTSFAKPNEVYPVPKDYPDRFTPRHIADRWEKEYLKNNPI